MGETIQIPAEEIHDVIEEAEEISVHPTDWGFDHTYVARRFDKFFRFTVYRHVTEGLQIRGPITALEVKPVPETITVWKPV